MPFHAKSNPVERQHCTLGAAIISLSKREPKQMRRNATTCHLLWDLSEGMLQTSLDSAVGTLQQDSVLWKGHYSDMRYLPTNSEEHDATPQSVPILCRTRGAAQMKHRGKKGGQLLSPIDGRQYISSRSMRCRPGCRRHLKTAVTRATPSLCRTRRAAQMTH